MATEFEKLVLGALNVLLGAAAAPVAGAEKKEAVTFYEDWLYRSRKFLEDTGDTKMSDVKVVTVAPVSIKEASQANSKDGR